MRQQGQKDRNIFVQMFKIMLRAKVYKVKGEQLTKLLSFVQETYP